MNYILSNVFSIYKIYKLSIVKSENVRLIFSLVGTYITSLFYPNSNPLLVGYLITLALEKTSNLVFNRLYLILKKNDWLYLACHYLHNLSDFTIIYYQIAILNKIDENLVASYISFIPIVLKAHYRLRLLVVQTKVVIYIGLTISLGMIFPIIYFFFRRFVNTLYQALSGLSVYYLQQLLNSFRSAMANGAEFSILYNNAEIITIPRREQEIVKITEEELEKIAPTQIPGKTQEVFTNHFVTDQCSICHDEYNESRQLFRVLPKCGHSFHCHCIDNWFFSGHSVCPMCRTELVSKN